MSARVSPAGADRRSGKRKGKEEEDKRGKSKGAGKCWKATGGVG